MSFLNRSMGATGRWSIQLIRHLLAVLDLFGRTLVRILGWIAGRQKIPPRSLWQEVDSLGVGSLGAIFLAFSAMGVSSILMSFEQLKNLGGLSLGLFFFDKAILRELGPVFAGVVMAVKIGAQLTARIGSLPPDDRWVVTAGVRERDLNRLLLPPFLAILVVGPALYLLGTFFGLLSGIVTQTRGSSENFVVFYRSILVNLSTSDLQYGMVKSFVFGILVVLVGGYVGFITPCDPEPVRNATVTSIVVCSVLILMVNAGFALSQTPAPLRQYFQGP